MVECAEDYRNGKIVSLSKEFVKEHYLELVTMKSCMKPGRRATKKPPIPALPDEIIKQTADLYASMYERLTGQQF